QAGEAQMTIFLRELHEGFQVGTAAAQQAGLPAPVAMQDVVVRTSITIMSLPSPVVPGTVVAASSSADAIASGLYHSVPSSVGVAVPVSSAGGVASVSASGGFSSMAPPSPVMSASSASGSPT